MKSNHKKVLYYMISAALAAVIAAGGIMCIRQINEKQEQESRLSSLAEFVSTGDGAFGDSVQADEPAPDSFSAYRILKEQNPDFTGWVKIKDTKINYPVMQTPAEPDYYLTHNFDKEDSSYGLPYISGWQDSESAHNLVIFGHHMRDKTMFAGLMDYRDEAFYSTHPEIIFDDMEKSCYYRIIGVLKVPAVEAEEEFYRLLFAENKEDCQAFIEEVKKRSFYSIKDIDGLTGDEKLLTLVTCEYSQREGRLFVVAAEHED